MMVGAHTYIGQFVVELIAGNFHQIWRIQSTSVNVQSVTVVRLTTAQASSMMIEGKAVHARTQPGQPTTRGWDGTGGG